MENKHSTYDAGYILIECAILLSVIGFVMSMSIGLFKIQVQTSAAETTNRRIETVSRAVSTYVQMRWRIPCPASSKGSSSRQFGIEQEQCDKKSNQAYGIVPYRTLGIPEHYARDGHGNFLTYVVSHDFTTNNRLDATKDKINIRHAHLIKAEDTALQPLSHFCAPIQYSETDIQIMEYGAHYTPITTKRDTKTVKRGTSPNTNLNKDKPVTAIAMALISHGNNEAGSFMSNGRQQRGGGTLERITYNTKNRQIHIQDEIKITYDEDHFDDIIRIYTQDELFALTGGSCAYL